MIRALDTMGRRLHAEWVARGRTGEGRVDVEGLDLSHLREGGWNLIGARFTRCKLDGARLTLSTLDESELIECTARQAILARVRLRRTRIEACAFVDADLRLDYFAGARVTGCDFAGALLDRTDWPDAAVEGVSFRGARVGDAKLDRGHFVDCDFSGADFALISAFLAYGTSVDARFERCDFTGANFEKRSLGGARFDDCVLAGVRGAPVLEGPVMVDGVELREWPPAC